MDFQSEQKIITRFSNLALLANQVVEGFISGKHKSPFHGFSSEFAEHKLYNNGESTKHIDWKLYAKTDRLYTKQYEEETNLRCHIILDNSSSMHYPDLKKGQQVYENKIGFSVLASAVLMQVLKKQRDAVGLSVYSDKYSFYASEKSSERHHAMLLNELENCVNNPTKSNRTDTVTYLHQIAENIHRRSMIVLFTDMFQHQDQEALFKALQHLKHNKHKVVVFHVYDSVTELNFDFDNAPKKFVDVETGETVQLYPENVKEQYKNQLNLYFEEIKRNCIQYQIRYVPVEVGKDFEKIMLTYLAEKQKFG